MRASPQGSASAPSRVAALLAGSDLRPRRLPAGALLCVRRLEDPAPRTLRLGTHSLRPPERWRERVVDSLDEALQRAARPALGAVPAGADSVLFADQAELLAALAREWCDGTAHTRWWWSLVASGAPPAAAVARAWLESADAAPAALELLAREGRAAVFARRLDAAQATAIALAVAERYGLRKVVAALQGASTADATPAADGARAAEAAAVPQGTPAPQAVEVAGRTADTPPAQRAATSTRWVSLVPEAGDAALAPAQRLLLVVLLVVRRRPPLAREPRFARALVRVATEPWPVVAAEAPAAASHAGSSLGPPDRETPSPAHDGSAGTRSPPQAVAATELESARRSDALRSPAATGATPDATATPAATPQADARPELSVTAAPDDSPPLPADSALTVRTGLGGLFMLVNAGIALGLYADFTSPLRPGIRLDPWHFVTLVGRRLLGPDGLRAYRTDAVWDLLSELGGDRPLGAGFRPPTAWRVPPEWLEAFDDDERPWRAGAAQGRLRVRHPAGFTVLDVAAAGNGQRQVARALARYGSPHWEPVRLPRARSRPPLERWLDQLVPYVAARLRLALGADASERLLPLPALIRTGPERIDVEIPLSQLPVEVRIAGLDRDPGWFPAAGRTIAFHFE